MPKYQLKTVSGVFQVQQMLNNFVLQHNYRSSYRVTINDEQSIVNVYRYENCKFQEPFLVLKPSYILSIFGGKTVCVEWVKFQEFEVVLISKVTPF